MLADVTCVRQVEQKFIRFRQVPFLLEEIEVAAAGALLKDAQRYQGGLAVAGEQD